MMMTLEESRAHPAHLCAHTATDKQVSDKLAHVQRCRRDTLSPPAFMVPVGWFKPAARSAKTRLRGAAAYPGPRFLVITMPYVADTA